MNRGRYVVKVEGAILKDGRYLMVVRGEKEYARWMTASEAMAYPETPPWTRLALELAEKARLARGW